MTYLRVKTSFPRHSLWQAADAFKVSSDAWIPLKCVRILWCLDSHLPERWHGLVNEGNEIQGAKYAIKPLRSVILWWQNDPHWQQQIRKWTSTYLGLKSYRECNRCLDRRSEWKVWAFVWAYYRHQKARTSFVDKPKNYTMSLQGRWFTTKTPKTCLPFFSHYMGKWFWLARRFPVTDLTDVACTDWWSDYILASLSYHSCLELRVDKNIVIKF